MSSSPPIPIFDGHNDVLLRLIQGKAEPERAFLEGDGTGQLDLPRMKQGGFAGGFFAIYIPSESDSSFFDILTSKPNYDMPLPDPVRLDLSQALTNRMASLLFRIERASQGEVKICRTAADIRHCIATGKLAVVFHIEGAEAIDPDLHLLDVLYAGGLRSIGPVWSRPNIFGHGVPFRYPSTPDIGPGLTEHGRALVRACNKLKIMIDLSHMNEKGFWDVAKLSDAPLVATHSNAHAITAHARNLTDRQLAAIRESGGMVGVNFLSALIRTDGQGRGDTPLDAMIRHMDYLIERVGVDGVGLGSDYDGGAIMPDAVHEVDNLQSLVQAMRMHGFGETVIHKILWQNWVDLLEKTWGT
jgi:membrane dipeptidase